MYRRRVIAAAAQALTLFLACSAWADQGPMPAEQRAIVRVPAQFAPGQIVVSLSDRRLYHVREHGRAISYPIATPRDQSLWQGTETVTAKRERPSWTPTPTMRQENPRLPPYVPGGHPYNPMGARALYLGGTYYRIHGTDAPWTIGQNVSKGCIRLLNDDIIDLYDNTPVGTKVTVTLDSLEVRAKGASDHATGRERAARGS